MTSCFVYFVKESLRKISTSHHAKSFNVYFHPTLITSKNSPDVAKLNSSRVYLWILFESKYSRLDQVKFFKGFLPQIWLDPFLNTLSHLTLRRRCYLCHSLNSVHMHFKNIKFFLEVAVTCDRQNEVYLFNTWHIFKVIYANCFKCLSIVEALVFIYRKFVRSHWTTGMPSQLKSVAKLSF